MKRVNICSLNKLVVDVYFVNAPIIFTNVKFEFIY